MSVEISQKIIGIIFNCFNVFRNFYFLVFQGIQIVNFVPRPGVESTSIVPDSLSIICNPPKLQFVV